MAEVAVPFKAFLIGTGNREVRRFEIDEGAVGSFLYLRAKIHAVFPSIKNNKFSVMWKDSDNEYIAVNSDEEWKIALNEAARPLKVFVKPLAPKHPELRATHVGGTCHICKAAVAGLYFMCVSCPNYNLCRSCESTGAHADHMLLRVVNPVDPLRNFGVMRVSMPRSNFMRGLIPEYNEAPSVSQSIPVVQQQYAGLQTRPNQSANAQPNQSANAQPNQSANAQPNQSANVQPNQRTNIQPNLRTNTQPNQRTNTQPNQPTSTQPNQPTNTNHCCHWGEVRHICNSLGVPVCKQRNRMNKMMKKVKKCNKKVKKCACHGHEDHKNQRCGYVMKHGLKCCKKKLALKQARKCCQQVGHGIMHVDRPRQPENNSDVEVVFEGARSTPLPRPIVTPVPRPIVTAPPPLLTPISEPSTSNGYSFNRRTSIGVAQQMNQMSTNGGEVVDLDRIIASN